MKPVCKSRVKSVIPSETQRSLGISERLLRLRFDIGFSSGIRDDMSRFVIANGAKQSRVPSFSRTVNESFGGQALFICLFKLLRSSFSITTKPSIDVAPGSTMSWCVVMTVMIAYLPGMGVSRIGEEWEKTQKYVNMLDVCKDDYVNK